MPKSNYTDTGRMPKSNYTDTGRILIFDVSELLV
jgi:hypothetical protein